MTRKEAIAIVTAKLPALDDDGVLAVADMVQAMDKDQPPLRKLTPRALALIEQSKEDFKAGRTFSHDEMVEMLDDRLALLGVPKSTA